MTLKLNKEMEELATLNIKLYCSQSEMLLVAALLNFISERKICT